MNGNSGNRPVFGSQSSDDIHGSSSADEIFGLNGDDTLDGGGGADTYHGGAGNDTYVLSDDGAIDTLHFRSDSYQQDVLDVSNIIPGGVDAGNLKNFVKVTDKGVFLDSAGQGQFSTENQIARFAANNPPFNAIIAVQIADTSIIQFDRSVTSDIPLTDESVATESQNAVTGTTAADDLMGTAGNDLLMGMAGADTLTGGLGADVYDGGEGNDRYVLTDTDSVDELSFISNNQQQDIIDVSALLPAGVTANNLKNYLKVTQDGVYLDVDGSGEFSSDDLIAIFRDGSDFSGDISIKTGSGPALQFDWLETAGVDLTDGNPFASSAELSNRFGFSAQGDGRGILNSTTGERFHLKLDEHSLTKALGGEGDELLDATSIAARGEGQSINDADHAVEIHAGRGNDTLRGNEDGVFLDAEEGDDRLEAGRGRNLLIGGAGDDEFALQLESSADSLKSDLLYDFTSNNEQRDVLDLTDVLPDSVNAGNVHSYVKITEAGVYIDTAGKAHFNEDSELARFGNQSSIDNLIRIKLGDGSGIEFNRDEAVGEMQGESGADKLRAGEGSDILRGNAGDDILDGDGLAKTKSADHLFGGEGNDDIRADKLDFTQGTVDGGTGFDRVTINEDAGENVNFDLHASAVERAEGGASNDTLDASGFTDTSGGYNKDTGAYETTEAQRVDLYGHDGRDTLIGGVGRDYLDGGSHADTLSGGQGLDFLAGGGGSDTFVLADDDELDLLWDFKSTGNQYDIIDISAFTGDNFNFNDLPNYFHIDGDYVYFDKAGTGTFTVDEAIAKIGDAVVIDNDYIKVEIDGTRIGYDPDGGTVVYINSFDPNATATGSTVAEDSAVNTVVGQVGYTDQDGVEPVTYSITGGNNNGYFAIDSSTGQVTLTATGAANIDYESSTTHTVQVTATDRDFSATPVNLVVNLSDVNDEAPNVSISSSPVDENSPSGTVLGQVNGIDPDTTGESISYAISSGNDNGYFAIDPATGQVTLTADGAAVFDYETTPSHTIYVTATDGANTSSPTPFTIQLRDINEAPEAGVAISKNATEDLSFILSEAELLANASDVDGDALSVSNLAVNSGQVSVADNGNGTWTVTPQNNWSGGSQLTFDISDGEFTVSSQADITVSGAADAPQLTVSGSAVISTMNFNGGLAAGWTSENSLETHSDGGPLGTSRSGTQIAELDANGTGNPDAYYYSVDTSQGHDHEVSIWVKQRSNYDNTDDIEIVWNGEVLQTIDPTTSWGEVTVTLPDTGSASTQLAIREVASENNGVGPLIDEITLTQIGAEDSVDPQYDKTLTSQEDTRIALDLSASLTDTDGSETLSVALGGIPAGFALTDGSNSLTTDGSDADVTSWNLANLTITPVANHDTDFTMTLSATATETSTGETNTSTQTIRIDMQPVADAATITGDDAATVYEDAASTLVKSGTLTATDPDAGEAVFVAETVSGSHGSVSINESGYWVYSADNSQAAIQGLSSSQTLKLNDSWEDYVRIESDLVPSDSFTVSMWVKPDTVDGSFHGFFGSEPAGVSSRSPSMWISGEGKLHWSSNGTDNVTYAGETSEVFTQGEWSHITWVKDGSEYRFYQDGNLVHTDTAPADVKLTGFTNLGRIDSLFDGELDDIQTYDRALTSSEISDAMGGETQSGLFAHYDFAGYSMNQALEDRAGNHPDGTANGSIGNSDLGDRPDTLTDTVTVRTADGTTHDINITISGNNDAPKIDVNSDSLSVSTNEDISLVLTRSDFLGNITDADDSSSLSIYDVRVEQGRATITDNHDGTWTLTPDADWSGSGKFSFGVSDGDKLIRTRGEFVVDSVADTPVISFTAGDNPTFNINEDESFALNLSSSFNDFDGSETHSLIVSNIPVGTTISDGTRSEVVSSGSLDIGSWTHSSLTITPAQHSHDDFDLTVTATALESDGSQSVVSQTVSVVITAVDDAPISSSVDLGATNEDTARVITKAELLANASDADGDTLSVSSVTLDSSAHGTLVDNGDETWTYTPTADFNGDDINFTLVVSDGTSGDEATVAVSLDVTSVADAPELQNALADQSVDEEVAFNWQLPADTFMDRDGDALTYSATLSDGSELPAWITFDANTRTFSGTPDDPDLGTLEVRVTASDDALSTSEDVSITVNSVNDLPVLSIDPREADAPVQLNATTAGDQDGLDMAMRADGGFVAVWVDKSEGAEGRIIGRMFDADGSPETAEFRIDNETTQSGSPKVAIHDDGSFIVAWTDSTPGVKSWVETQSFDASGNPQSSNKTALSGSNYEPEVITLDGGDYVVATFDSWHGMRTEVQVYDSNGNAKSGVITTGSLSGWGDRDYELTNLSDGNWAHAFRKTSTGDVEINIYDATGSSVGSATVNASEAGFDLVSLEGGGVAAVYRDEGSTKLQLLNNDGSSNGSEIDLGVTAGTGLIVEALNDGGMFVGWEEDGGLFGQRFLADGTVASGKTQLTDDADASGLSVSELDDGSLQLGWHTSGVDGDGSAVVKSNLILPVDDLANGTVVARVSATDDDLGDTLTFSLANDAGGRYEIDSSTGDITVADGSLIDYAVSPSHTLTVAVSDGTVTETLDYTIYNNNNNKAPETADNSITAREDISYSFSESDFPIVDPNSADYISEIRIESLPDAGSLTLSGSAVSIGDTISVADIQSGNLKYLAGADDNGSDYTSFTFNVADRLGLYSSTAKTITVDVSAENDAPIVANAVGNQTTAEDSGLVYQVPENTFIDIDGDSLTYTATLADGSVLPAWLNFDAATRTFSGTPDDPDLGTVQVRVTASDGSLSSSADVSITVTGVNDAPTTPEAVVEEIDFVWGGSSISNKNAASYELPDGFQLGDSIWLTKTDGGYGKGVKVQISDNGDGTLNAVVIEAKYTNLGTWNSLSAEQKTTYFESAGTDQNVATSNSSGGYGVSEISINGGPVASGFLDTTNGKNVDPFAAVENTAVSTVIGTVTASDVEGDNLTFSLTNDAGGRFSINSTTGEISVGDGSLLDYETATSHGITVQVSDGQTTSTQDYTIRLSDTNEAPELVSAVADQVIVEEAVFSYTIPEFTDEDGDSVSLSAALVDGNPLPGWLSFDDATRTFSGTPDDADLGTIQVRVTASDGSLSTTADVSITVTSVNDTPIASVDSDAGNASVDGSAISGTSSVLANDSDADGDSLSITDVNGTAVSGSTVIAGDFGDLTIGSDGSWTYNPDTPDLTSGLVGHWNFDGNTLDSASGDSISDDGVLKGDAAVNGGGLNGSSLNLTNNGDGLFLNDSNEIDAQRLTDRTINLSFRIDEANDLSSRQVLFEEGGVTTGLNAYIDSGKLYIGGYDESVGWDGTWYSMDVPSDNNFHNLTLVMGNNELSGYVDGNKLTDVVQDISTGTKEMSSDHQEFIFGARHGDMTFHDGILDDSNNNIVTQTFIGEIDEARIYNRALNDQEVQALDYEFKETTLQDVFTYTVSDGTDTSTSTLTIDVNRVPEALSGTLSGSDTGEIAGQLSAADFDIGETLTYALEAAPAKGSVTINANGSYTFNPGSDFESLSSVQSEDVTFDFRVTDSQGDTSVNTITVTVTGTNVAPELTELPMFDSVVAAYNFSDGSGSTATDTSGAGNDISLSGSATFGTGHGGTGTAFEMNGSSGGGDLGAITTGGSMTVSTWVKFDSFAQSWSRIFDFGDGSANDNILIGHTGTSNALGFNVYDGAGSPSNTSLEIDGFFTAGEWVHVTATISDSGVMSVYKNGELAGSVQGIVPTEMVRTNNFIGKSNWGQDGALDGSIDDFAIFNEALSAEDVKALYQADSVDNLLDDALYISENSNNSSSVGTVASSDGDGDTLTYSLTNDAGGRFTINSSTGEITVADGSLLDHESATSHAVSVQVSDGYLSDTRDYTVYVTNVNDAPVSADATLTTAEDDVITLSVSDFAFTDADSGDSLAAVVIKTLPAAGTLALNGVVVTADQSVSKADIEAGLLTFTTGCQCQR